MSLETSQVQPDTLALDPKLLGELARTHHERLYRFVLMRIGDACEAEELAQQAFVEAARTFASFRGEAQLSTWLFGIALNLVRNHLSRAPKRLYKFECDSALSDMPGPAPNPEQQCAATQLLRELQIELDALLPEMREVLLSVTLDELSYEQAASMMNLPVGTVRSRVSRARSHLRSGLQARGVSLPF